MESRLARIAAPLLLVLLSSSPGAASDAASDMAEMPVVYRVSQTTRLDQIDEGAERIHWWISIPGNDRYQDLLDFTVVSAPGPWKVVRDEARGNRFLYVEVEDKDAASVETVVEFTLRRDPVWIDLDPERVGPITEAHRRIFAEELQRDAPHMEVTPEIHATAGKVCGDETNVARQAGLLLDFVADEADHYSKDSSKPSCGIGDAADCMANDGGCCTDLHSLFIALARDRGIPARLQMGYRLLERNVGRADVDPGYRCWVEYFTPGYGWVPADIVEGDALDGPGRDRWFTGLTARRLWLNQGREFRFEGAESSAPVNHMSLGYAEIDGVPARVLPEGDLPAQLTRRVTFTEVGKDEPTTVSMVF